jgi:hypothetical protein
MQNPQNYGIDIRSSYEVMVSEVIYMVLCVTIIPKKSVKLAV